MTPSIFGEPSRNHPPLKFNLAQYVLAAGTATPDKTALEILAAPGTIQEKWLYKDLTQAVLGVATGFQERGLSRGDKIVLRIGNSAGFPLAFLGAIAFGAIPVPTSSHLTEREFRAVWDDLGDAKCIVCDDDLHIDIEAPITVSTAQIADFHSLPAAQFADTNKDDPAYIVYTSGSSGRPKGVVHAHRVIWARRMMWDGWYAMTPQDRMLHAGAFNWTFTLGTGLLDPWSIGATALVYSGPNNKHVWSELAHSHQATLFAGAPGVLRQLLTSKRDLKGDFRNLRHAIVAGEALSETVRTDWEVRTGCEVFEALGMSEISTFISGCPANSHRAGTVGKPQAGRHISVRGEDGPVPMGRVGNLAVHRSDPGLMLGYYAPSGHNLPLEEDWFITGDRVAMDQDHFITYHGRSDTVITSGGFRFAPEEAETVIMGFADVSDAAVAAVEVKPDVTVPIAFIVAHDQFKELDFKNHLSKHLADYKRPRDYVRVSTLPRRGNGKLDRQALPQLWKPNDQA